jgi:hypothetical protein
VDIHVAHAGHCAIRGTVDAFVRSFRNNDRPDLKLAMESFFSKAVTTNLQHASSLSPRNARLIALVVFMKWCNVLALQPERSIRPGSVPDELHDEFRIALASLDELAHDRDKTVAAGAMEAGAMLRFFLSGNTTGSRAVLQELVVLDPSREQAWEMLMAAALEGPNPVTETIQVCEQRLKSRDSARNRLMLAKALAKAEQWDKAHAQARLAADLDPVEAIAPLLLVALEIRQSADQTSLRSTLSRLTRAQSLIERMPSGAEREQRLREFALNAAILAGLNGSIESARALVEKVLARNPDDEIAKEILACLPAN